MSLKLYSLGKWCARAGWRVIAVWALVLALAVAGMATLSKGLTSSVTIPGTESQQALDGLAKTFPQVSGTSAQIVIVAPQGQRVTGSAYRTAVRNAVKRLDALDQVTAVVSPYSSQGKTALADDRRAAIIQVQMDGQPGAITAATKSRLYDIRAGLRDALPDARVELGGPLFSFVMPTAKATEGVGLIVALVVMFLTLGSLLAAGMPILVAVTGVAVTASLIFAATSFMPLLSATPVLSVMLGLAVGIDYSLFIISRHRDQLAEGVPARESAARAVATSGSAVVFAGLTVIIALLGLSVVGLPFLARMGLAAAVGVAMAVLLALTLLPAMLGLAGERLSPLRRRRRARGRTARAAAAPSAKPRRGFFDRWVSSVTKIPAVTVAVIVIAALACIPSARALRLDFPDAGSLDKGMEARQAYDLVTDHFGEGYNAVVLVTADIIQSTDPVGLMDKLGDEVAKVPGVKTVAISTPNPDADTGIVQVIPDEGSTSPRTEQLVRTLRADRQRFHAEFGVNIQVTGYTPVTIDVSQKLGQAMAPFGALVAGLSLVLLMVVFRSIWVPVSATLGYLISVVAAFAATQMVFGEGFLAGLLRVTRVGAVISFMPVIVMGILFGLAMDYEVFLVSRMREEYVHSGDARGAIHAGFVKAASVVTAAAIIMFSVFAAFIPEGDATIKPMALGLAVGVFVDAFVVRMTLVPAVLALLGDQAWRLPKWLDRRLPVLDVEGEGMGRELELRAWKATGDVVASDVPLGSPDSAVLWNARAERGGVHAVVGPDPVVVSAALLTATGRMKARGGRLRVLGWVLPGREAEVRGRAAYVDVRDGAVAVRALRRAISERPHLVALDGADHAVEPWVREGLRQALVDTRGVTILIGAADLAAVRALVQPDTVSCAGTAAHTSANAEVLA